MSVANPLLVASVSDQLLTSTDTTSVLSETVTAGNYILYLYARLLQAAGLTISASWTDGAGDQSQTVLQGSHNTGALPVAPLYLNNVAGTVAVTATAGTANAAAISAALKRV